MQNPTKIFVDASGADPSMLPRPLAAIVGDLRAEKRKGDPSLSGLNHDHYCDQPSYDHTCQRPRKIKRTQ